MGRAKNGRNKAGTGDFIFENYKEQDSDKYEKKALELMCRHFEFYGQLNSPDIEYVTRGAKLSCTHGNRYIYLDAARDHGVYDGKNPVLTCKDCKKEENIKDFGACGNGKFEPLYSEEAPHPAQTALNRNGQERYVCLPVLLGEWGYGDINSRSLLIGEVLIDKAYKVYKKESFDSGEFSEDTIEQIAKNQIQNMVEDVEYSQALMKCDNLLCLYGGVITIEENPEPEEESVIEDNSEMGELEEENLGLPRGEEIYITSWLKAYKGEPDGKNGKRVYYDKEARELLRTDYPKIDWYSYEEQTEKNGNCADHLEGQEFISTDRGVLIDEKERYWITLGPRVIDSDYPDTGNCQAEYFADSIGCRVDVVLSKMDNKDEHIYLECVWSGNIKAHTSGNGIYQTGVPYINSTQAKTEPFKEEYVNGSIIEFTGKDPHETGTMSEYMVDYLIVYPKELTE